MSSGSVVDSARRKLTGKRADTVLRLGQATLEVLRELGYDRLTLQAVATKAGVARATAYTYFSSREHLVADLYWRRLAVAEPPNTDSPDATERVVATLRFLATMTADDPTLTYALNAAMNSADPDVDVIRHQSSRRTHQLIKSAVGDGADTETVLLLEVLLAGTTLRAGVGAMSHAEVADLLEKMVRRIMTAPRPESDD